MKSFSISSQFMIDELLLRGIKVKFIDKDKNLFGCKINGTFILSKNIDCGLNSALGYKIAEDKELTYTLLQLNKIKIPQSIYLEKKQINGTIPTLNFPLVVKPIDGSHGDGVTVDITKKSDLQGAYKHALNFSNKIVVQELIKGDDFRLLVVGNKLVAAAQRIPPFIVGDGILSVKQLIEKENLNPLRSGNDHTSPLSKILFDEESKNFIKKLGFGENSILPKNTPLTVRGNANLSTGGISVDVTHLVHSSIKKVAINSLKACGLIVGGVDIITKDITIPLEKSQGAVIEINATPGLRMHYYPSQGQSKNVCREIVNLLLKKYS